MARLHVLSAFLFLALVSCELVATELIEDEDTSVKDLKELEDDKLDGAKRFQWRRCRWHSQCGVGYYCRWGWCYPRKSCSGHMHCDLNSYCDTSDRVCKPGKRRCRKDRHCRSYYMYCKNNVCEKKQCFHHYQCPSGQICQKPGVCVNYVQTCKTHRQCKVPGYICINELCKKRQCYNHRHCSYGYQCVTPGLCQLRRGYCLDESNCLSNQCCLKRWSHVKVGMCSYHQRPGHWCDVQEKYSCPCVQGYACRRRGYWGTCVSAPTTSPPQPTTVEPTTVEPTTVEPTTVEPNTVEPTTVEPTEEPGSGSGDFEL